MIQFTSLCLEFRNQSLLVILSLVLNACNLSSTPPNRFESRSDESNTAPFLSSYSIVSREDEEVIGSIQASDSELDDLQFQLLEGPSLGVLDLDLDTGAFVYQPEENFHGSVNIRVKASDGDLESDEAVVTFKILPVDDKPYGDNLALTVDEDDIITGVLQAFDVDSDEDIYFFPQVEPQNGSLEINSATGEFTYIPNENFNGTDSFVYRVSNSQDGLGTVEIQVLPVNDITILDDVNLEGIEDTPTQSLIAAFDLDNDELDYNIVEPPSFGSATLDEDGLLIYIPNPNFYGNDQLRVSVTDNIADPVEANVFLMIVGVNDEPIAEALAFDFTEDQVGQGQLLASDVDNVDLDYFLVQGSPNADILINQDTGLFDFVPNENFNGSANFTWRAYDGEAYSTVVTASVQVQNINDVPTLNDLVLETNEDQVGQGQLIANDWDDDDLSFAKVSEPQNGSASVNPISGVVTYTPDSDFFGSDSLSVSVTDGLSDPIEATVNIQVLPVDDAPVAGNLNFEGEEDQALLGQLSATDVDGPEPRFEILTQPASGELVLLNPETGDFRYTPEMNASGGFAFTFKAISNGLEDIGNVTLNIIGTNDAPVIDDQGFNVNEDEDLSGTIVAFDLEDDDLNFFKTEDPTNGSVTVLGNGNFDYIPNPDFFGQDSFKVRASDGNAQSNEATMTITVVPVDDAPEATPSQFVAVVNSGYQGQLSGTDIDSDINQMQFFQVAAPAHGELAIDQFDGSFTYTPDANYSGPDQFRFRVRTEGLFSQPATVSISVTEDLGIPEFIFYYEIEAGLSIQDNGIKLASLNGGLDLLTRVASEAMNAQNTHDAAEWNNADLMSQANVLIPGSQGQTSVNANSLVSYDSDPDANGIDEVWVDFGFDQNALSVRLEQDGAYENVNPTRVAFVIRFCDPGDPCSNSGYFLMNNWGTESQGNWQVSGDYAGGGNYGADGDLYLDAPLYSLCAAYNAGIFIYILDALGLPPDLCD